jgi:hypothetical protein
MATVPRNLPRGALRCRRKFLRFFPGGFRDPRYIDWERGYKERAHLSWSTELDERTFRSLLSTGRHSEVAARAIRIESRTNLLFSFEKMAIRDAVRTPSGAKTFAAGLFELLHGNESPDIAFDRWCTALESLPRRQTRVLTWPLATVFGFIAQPRAHIFLKPRVTREAARLYGYDFEYRSRPTWKTYESLLGFATEVRRDLRDLRPRDLIDIQSFIWVQGSDEYDE